MFFSSYVIYEWLSHAIRTTTLFTSKKQSSYSEKQKKNNASWIIENACE